MGSALNLTCTVMIFWHWLRLLMRHPPSIGIMSVSGTTEDMPDCQYNNGEVVNTLRKFPAAEKAYMEQYDEWKKR